MAADTTYWVQGFEHVAGRLTPTISGDAESEAHALLQAEAMARRLAGAAAFARARGADRRPFCIILGAFGDVPDDLADGLAGG